MEKFINLFSANGEELTRHPIPFNRLDVTESHTVIFTNEDVSINLPWSLNCVTMHVENHKKQTTIINWLNDFYAIIEYA